MRQDLVKGYLCLLALLVPQALLSQVSRDPLPWQAPDPKKHDEFNVWTKMAPRGIVARTMKPIKDSVYIGFLERRSRTFSFKNRELPFQLVRHALLDIGSLRPNSTSTFAPIDLTASPAVAQLLKELWMVTPDTHYLLAGLHSDLGISLPLSRERKKLTYGYKDEILTVAASKDLREVILTTISETDARLLQKTSIDSRVSSVERRRAWPMLGRLDLPFHQGYRRAVVGDPRGWTWEEIKEIGALIKADEKMRGTMDITHYVDVVLSRSDGDAGDEEEAGDDCKMPDDVVTASKGAIATGSYLQGVAGLAIGTEVTIGDPPMTDSGGPYWGPEEGYGAWFCYKHCSRTECRECCDDAFSTQLGSIGAFAAACHGTSDGCPWCHIGCAAAEIGMTIAAGVQLHSCKDNCGSSYFDFDPSGRSCP